MRALKLPVGQSSLEKIFDEGNLFVDNTHRIIPAFLTASKISVCYFPRRFGKTLASGKKGILDLFFNIRHAEKARQIFSTLKIADVEEGRYLQQYGNKFPVINFSFNEVSAQGYQHFLESFRSKIARTYAEFKPLLLESHLLEDWQKQHIIKVANPTNELSQTELQESLLFLLQCLFQHYKQKVIVLIDEYDAPLQKSYLQVLNASATSRQSTELNTIPNHDYQQIVEFMKAWLQYGLKDKEEVYKGFVTGVLEVARETLFSGFNNAIPYGMGNDQYAGCFGFVEDDVKALIDKMDWLEPGVRETHFRIVQEWYNGYMIGANRHLPVLNPWSVLQYISNIPALPKAYWLNVADNGLIKNLLTRVDTAFKQRFLELLSGNSIEISIQENMTFEHLTQDQAAVWGLFLQVGYLKVEKITLSSPFPIYTVRIPNREVRAAYHASFVAWLEPSHSQDYQQLLQLLKTGNVQAFQAKINHYLMTTTSYFDFENADEARYHCFMLGILIALEGEYQIRSNRESGSGRYDIALFPRDPAAKSKLGILFEFKHTEQAAQQHTLTQAALQQIEQRQYKTEFQDRNIHEIIVIGACFHKKSVIMAQKRIILQGSATAQMATTLYTAGSATTSGAPLKRKASDADIRPLTPVKQLQLETPLLSATFEGKNIQLERHATKGDGQCGFYALPLADDRAGAQKLLLEHAGDRRIRELVAPEIRAAIIENNLPAPLKEIWSDWYNAYLTLSDSFHRLLARARQLYPAMAQDLSPQDIIQYMRGHPNLFLRNTLQDFEKTVHQVNQHEAHLMQALIETPHHFIEFINQYIGTTGHLSFVPQQTSSLDAIAHIQEWRIHIWQPDASGTNAGIVHRVGPETGTPHHLLHMPGVDTHFELLTINRTLTQSLNPF